MLEIMRARLLCLIVASGFSLFGFTTKGQGSSFQDSDSTVYFSDYSELLALRLYSNVKASHLDIIKESQELSLRPNSPASLGVGFNYKGYGLGIALGLPVSATSKNRYGKTKRFDLQANVYKENLGIDGFAQFYKGYYNSNPQDFIEWKSDAFPKLPDMRIISIGLNAFYIFNDEKFSFKAAFVRNQVQHKSAGSFTAGVFGHYDESTTEQGFKPVEFPDSIGNNFDLKSFNALAIGVTFGYLYTWVISEHFFINIGVTPGIWQPTNRVDHLGWSTIQ